jgi:hypothetical protein
LRLDGVFGGVHLIASVRSCPLRCRGSSPQKAVAFKILFWATDPSPELLTKEKAMSLSNGPTQLQALFAATKLYVPRYQRAYAWEVKPHVATFLDDLGNHPGGNPYFLGTVLLTKDSSDIDGLFTRHAIVDGQKRLTTACIFMVACQAALRNTPDFQTLAEHVFKTFVKDSNERKFNTVRYDDQFFEQNIIRGIPGGTMDTQSKTRLKEAAQFSKKVWKECRLKMLPNYPYAETKRGTLVCR